MSTAKKIIQAAAGNVGGEVFSADTYTGNAGTQTITNDIDLAGSGGMVWIKGRSGFKHVLVSDAPPVTPLVRTISTNSSDGPVIDADAVTAFNSDGFSIGPDADVNNSGAPYVAWTFRREPTFFDVLQYTGNGSTQNVSHNLGSVPGCILVKRFDSIGDWQVYHRANTANPETDYLVANEDDATADLNTVWNDTAPTDSVFSVGANSKVNGSAAKYLAILFGHDDLAVNRIRCGSYTGNGTSQTIDCGFESGARYVMTKRTDADGNWSVFDSARGIIAGNDPRMEWNLTAGDDTGHDFVDPDSSGFVVNFVANDLDDTNISGATYIFIAIA